MRQWDNVLKCQDFLGNRKSGCVKTVVVSCASKNPSFHWPLLTEESLRSSSDRLFDGRGRNSHSALQNTNRFSLVRELFWALKPSEIWDNAS